MSCLQTVTSGFRVLGAIGFTLLWPVMLYNGTLVALLQAAWTGAFRDGRPLLTTYTHFPPLDFMISILVAFFYDQINGLDDGAWLLMLDLVATLQAASLWVLVEANRGGQRKRLLELYVCPCPSLRRAVNCSLADTFGARFFNWPLMWNLVGAATVLPFYVYLHTQSTESDKPNPIISTARPRSLIIVSLLGVSVPAVFLLSAYTFASEFARQVSIAVFVLSPLLLDALVAIVSYPKPNLPGGRRTSSDHVRYIYIWAGLASGGAHVYTLARTLLSQKESVGLATVFMPSPSGVIPGSVNNIHDGALLFLQYDWIVVNITCWAWAYLLIESPQVYLGVKGWAARGLLTLLTTLFIGPGATVSCALYLRGRKPLSSE
ncbi:hypothetical protein PG984_015586 [Apiospora sp. TS-2023a]